MRCREPQRVRNIFEGPLAVKVTAAPPDYAYRDIDNIHKALFDSLKHASVYVDDHQIINLCSYWMEPRRDDPRVWVTIDEIEAPEWWKRRADATLKRRRRAASTSSRAT
jgi:Holliday junction resolvase RusA-like endonuclease